MLWFFSPFVSAVMASSDSLVTPEHKEESQNIQDSQESDYPGSNNASVAMRKKLQGRECGGIK